MNESSPLLKSSDVEYANGTPYAINSEGMHPDYEFEDPQKYSHASPHANSTPKSFLILIKSFLGSGILFLPNAFATGGLAFSLFFLALMAWMSYEGIRLLVECRFTIEGSTTYAEIGEKAYGKPLSYAIQISIVISQCGLCCAYFIFLAQNLQQVLNQFSNCDSHVANLSVYLLIAIQVLIHIPMSLIRRMKYFSIPSLIGDLLIATGLMYIFVRYFLQISEHGISHDFLWINPSQCLVFIGTVVFTFEGIGLVIPIVDSMEKPRDFNLILAINIGMLCLLFGVFSSIGYITYGPDVNAIILLDMPQNTATSIIQLGYCMAIFCSFPLQLFPATKIMELVIFGERTTPKPTFKQKWSKNLFRAVFVLVMMGIAMLGNLRDPHHRQHTLRAILLFVRQ
eukprot:TRINITY_DN326_c0_g2_i3.p1 TRINITY_DN326_c0_g2~~TRINITY_DN326_c0_g2_i3.p1  ORF type:complete len:397 (-),score=105.23 TRINITY_DN326_c0_g2_i3:298-1488(-)